MAKNSWIIDNLEHALDTWNEKMNEIWQLVTESPADFKGGGVWRVITDIHGRCRRRDWRCWSCFL